MRVVPRQFAMAVGAVGLAGAATLAHAQGGPPLITNDPGTPGAGHWEINLAAAGSRMAGQWDIATPDVDVNYGWGAHVQLSLHVPWNHRKTDGQRWSSAPGPVELAVRWRFLDEDRSGVAMAIQPHWVSAGLADAVRKDLAPDYQEFVLPLQMAKSFGKSILGVEIARHLAKRAPDAWQAGVFWANACGQTWQCLAEVNSTRAQGSTGETTVNIGARHSLSQHVILMGTLGKQVSGESPRASSVFYVGVQLLR